MSSTKPGTQNVPRNVELSPEFRRNNYTETIARMYANGLCSKRTAKEMLARVDTLVGEDVE
jgi:hypothetical protein